MQVICYYGTALDMKFNHLSVQNTIELKAEKLKKLASKAHYSRNRKHK